MMNAENVIKSYLDGTFMKFAGSYGEGKWPFSPVAVEPDFIPNYCRKSYTELAQEDGRRGPAVRMGVGHRKGGAKMRVITGDEIKLIRQHEAEGIKQEYTRAQLGMGSETWARARLAAGFKPRKWENV